MVHLPNVATGLADPDSIAAAVASADVVIGAVLVAGRKAPHVVTRHMVENMRRGSVIIDVAIDQGGCVETSRPTTLAEPSYIHHGVVHYCVPNLTADMSRSASMALAQALLPYLLRISEHGIERGAAKLAGAAARRLHARRRLRAPQPGRGPRVAVAAAAGGGGGEQPEFLGVARMSWMEEYRARLKTADEALSVLKSGDRVYIHQGCGEPEDLVQAMVRRGPELRDVEVVHLATMGSAEYARPEFEGHFRHNAFFIGANVRRRRAGRARRLHPHLSFRDRGPVAQRRAAPRRGADPVLPARPLRLHEPGHGHRHHADGGQACAARDCGGERPVSAHARRRVPAREQGRRHRRGLASAGRVQAAGGHRASTARSRGTWRI